jgi:hypothetical protein
MILEGRKSIDDFTVKESMRYYKLVIENEKWYCRNNNVSRFNQDEILSERLKSIIPHMINNIII